MNLAKLPFLVASIKYFASREIIYESLMPASKVTQKLEMIFKKTKLMYSAQINFTLSFISLEPLLSFFQGYYFSTIFNNELSSLIKGKERFLSWKRSANHRNTMNT